jgi:hypothetical protein
MKIQLLGSELTDSIAAAKGTFSPGRLYHLAPLRLLRVGCPREIQASRENTRMVPIVVEKNRRELGKVAATGWSPEAVVVAGSATRHALLDRGDLEGLAWIEAGLDIKAEDEISCEELCQKLQSCVTAKFYGAKGPQSLQPSPYIAQVYPFENYTLYCMEGQKYRQSYTLDPMKRSVALDGLSIKVDEKYLNASSENMPKVQSGLRTVTNPIPLAWNQVSWRSGGTSELMTQVVRDFTNIMAQVTKLRNMIKHGLLEPMMPDFSPVALGAGHHVLAPFIKAGIAPVDVVRGLALLESRA